MNEQDREDFQKRAGEHVGDHSQDHFHDHSQDQCSAEFFAKVFHELRAPLTSMLGFATLINKNFTTHFMPLAENDPRLRQRGEKIIKNLDVIDRGGWRLSRLISDVQDLHRMESGRMQWQEEEVGVHELLREVLASGNEVFISRPDLDFDVSVPDDLPRVWVDRERFGQLLFNLLSNAFRFTPSGSVNVRAAVEKESLRITVRDSGLGIAADQLEKVFTAFYQPGSGPAPNSSVPSGHGHAPQRDTGLGLAICRKIVEHYQGRIWAESQPGQGSSFTVALPLSVIGVQSKQPSQISPV